MLIKKTSQFGIFIFLLKKISDKSCTKIQENEEKVNHYPLPTEEGYEEFLQRKKKNQCKKIKNNIISLLKNN